MQNILEQFLTEEANSHVRRVILAAAQEHERKEALPRSEMTRTFEFNRFEVTLDFAHDLALIADVLNPVPSGELHLPLDEFLARLRT